MPEEEKQVEEQEQLKPPGAEVTTPAGGEGIVSPPADEKTRLQAELAESKQRQTGWDKAMGRLHEQMGRMEQRQDHLLSLMSQGDSSPALKERFQRLEMELARTKDLIQAQQGTPEEGGTALSYEQKLLAERQTEEAAAKKQWEDQVAHTTEVIEDDLREAGVPLTTLSADKQFMSLWASGKLREARLRAKAFVSGIKANPQPQATAPPVETEEGRIDRLAQERLQTELKKRGLLLNDQGGGGSNKTWDGVRMRFGENPDDKENTALYYKMRREKGI